jgi:hypothetical protein
VTAYNGRVLGEETRFRVEEVRGTPFRRLVLVGVHVERTSAEGTYAFLSARELHLTYDVWGLLHGRYEISRARAQGLVVDFRTDGTNFPATFRKGAARSRPFLDPRLTCGWRGQGRASRRNMTVDSWSGRFGWRAADGCASMSTTCGESGDELGHLGWTRALPHRSHRRLEDLEGYGRFDFAVSGTAAKGPVDLDIQLAELPLERVGRFFQAEHLEPGYVKHAKGTLRAQNGRMTFDLEGEATWAPWTADTLVGQGILADGVLRLRDVNASIEGASFTDVDLDIPIHESEFTARGRARNLNTATLRIPFFDLVPGTVSGRADIRFRDRKSLGRNMDLKVCGGMAPQVPIRAAWCRRWLGMGSSSSILWS